MSMPTSAIACTATGLTWSAGIDPADRTSTRPPESAVRKPAAIWERPALCTHTNNTLGLSDIDIPPERVRLELPYRPISTYLSQ